jgi:hypothetical protein
VLSVQARGVQQLVGVGEAREREYSTVVASPKMSRRQRGLLFDRSSRGEAKCRDVEGAFERAQVSVQVSLAVDRSSCWLDIGLFRQNRE